MKRLLFICLIFVNAVFGLADADEVTDLCAERWPDDAGMYQFCIDNQNEAKSSPVATTAYIKDLCSARWENDYDMRNFCVENQNEAQDAFDDQPESSAKTACSKRWGNDYDMANFCLENELEDLTNIDPRPALGNSAEARCAAITGDEETQRRCLMMLENCITDRAVVGETRCEYVENAGDLLIMNDDRPSSPSVSAVVPSPTIRSYPIPPPISNDPQSYVLRFPAGVLYYGA